VTTNKHEWLAERFEANRTHLRAVAYRMLGSRSEADDAVQEAWLRLSRSDTSGVENLGGWLTTVVARVCLDMLRSRRARREEPLDTPASEQPASGDQGIDAEHEVLLAESVGLALLVVLKTLAPAERVAFVLHDMFDLPYAEIAPIVGRSKNTAAQLASRARRRVRGKTLDPATDLVRQRRLVDAFLAAARDGDFDALLAVLDGDVVLHVDATAAGTPTTIRGAQAVAANARAFSANARFAEPALVDGAVGIVVAPKGKLALVLQFAVTGELISEISIDADPARLSGLSLAVLD
jgi:RNA polymerase sigma factor (sigma-70 family)